MWSTGTWSQTDATYISEGPVFIENVTLIDGLGNAPVAGRDILITNGKIAAISRSGQSTAPSEATVIDGGGLTAYPGLIDLHYHLKGGWSGGNAMQDKYPPSELLEDSALQQSLAALLYAGVTAAFDMGSTHSWIVEQRDRINSGEFIGPRYYIVGVPFSMDPSGWDGAVRGETVGEPPADGLSTKVDTEDSEALGAILDRYAADGIRTIKLYSGISALGATFLLKEAKKRDITAVADLWQMNFSADWMRMTGLDGWAHASPYKAGDDGLKWMAENDRFVVPTITVGEKLSGLRVKDDGDNQSFFDNPLVTDIWGREVVEDFYASYPDVRENLYEGPHSFYQYFNFGDLSKFRDGFLDNTKRAHDAGVLIGCGTDAPAYPTLWSGESLHREMELLVMAGLTPIEAIKSCTYNSAKILREDEQFGSIQVGRAGDLVLVEGNPSENISDTRKIIHVIYRGGVLDREALLNSWK
jgi:imidazolonepropionase-like amidohydrolase